MLDNNRLAQEMFNLSKDYWLTTMNLMTGWQKQNEKMWNNLLEQGVVAQQEGRKMLQEWLNGVRQTQEQYNNLMEDTWEKAGTVFGTTPKTGK